jgi:hypothetical protein
VAFDISMQATYFEESFQEPGNPTTTEPLTTEQVSFGWFSMNYAEIGCNKHGNVDTEGNLIDGVNAASSEHPASVIKVNLPIPHKRP